MGWKMKKVEPQYASTVNFWKTIIFSPFQCISSRNFSFSMHFQKKVFYVHTENASFPNNLSFYKIETADVHLRGVFKECFLFLN